MIAEHLVYQKLAEQHPKYFRVEQGTQIETKHGPENIYVFHLYDQTYKQKNLPVFSLFAGVHGIEAIGVKILFHFIHFLLEQTKWNESVRSILSKVKIIGIPIVNPAGFIAGTRCNANGVDLMRNSPVESNEQWPLIGGQRLSNKLPWFRGSQTLEVENLEILRVVRDLLGKSPFSISLDIHSGFGIEDCLWTPYAKEKGFPPTWNEYLKLKLVIDRALKHHVYKFEPQSVNYCTSGDVWDYLYDENLKIKNRNLFLPLTLEVGSWVWIKKSPRSAFQLRNFFNPVHPHRERRVLRRHLLLLNMLAQAAANHTEIF